MEILIYIIVTAFGLLFGSFSSVLIHRLKSGEKGIWGGRSHCPKCDTNLKFYDLFPIFSWISTFGKCRYCKAKISFIYPILELSMGLAFLLISIFIIDINQIILGNYLELIKMIYWLFIGFITVVYIFYDILFLEIHEGVMFFGIILALLGLFINDFGFQILNTINVSNNLFLEKIVAFIISIISIGLFYMIMIKEMKIRYDLLILSSIVLLIIGFKEFFDVSLKDISSINALISAFAIFLFFFLQIVLSGGRALGGGDLRIGIMIGLILGISYSFAGMMITYIVGSFISIFVILIQKIKQKGGKINTQVPFGPFLGIGFLMVIFFQNYIDYIIEIYFKNL